MITSHLPEEQFEKTAKATTSGHFSCVCYCHFRKFFLIFCWDYCYRWCY